MAKSNRHDRVCPVNTNKGYGFGHGGARLFVHSNVDPGFYSFMFYKKMFIDMGVSPALVGISHFWRGTPSTLEEPTNEGLPFGVLPNPAPRGAMP